MEILVTGGAGFIGSAVVRALLADGHRVRVLDALLPEVHGAQPPRPPAGVMFRHGDVRDAALLGELLTGVDVVVHQAAMVGLGVDLGDLPGYVGHNDLGTAVLLAAMARAGVTDLVLAGSMVVYGEGGYRCAEHGVVSPAPRRVADLEAGRFEPPCPRCGVFLAPESVTESAALDPRSVYAVTKAAQEQLAGAWARACGGRVLTLRYHNVYGPGMHLGTPYAGVAALFRGCLQRGEAPRVFEDGGQRRDFVHVDDVAAANLAAVRALAGRPGGSARAYNIGSGEVRTVGELARELARASGGPEPVTTGQFRLGDVRHITADSGRARAELGWSPRVRFAEGVHGFARG